ncbi:MAG: hypothetical protein J6Y51_00235 [Bacteroidaceae bacterium]|nr:hypothetical protein [Bacteroidaceae bacterium]
MKKNLLILVAFLTIWSINAGADDNVKSIMSASSGAKGGGMSFYWEQMNQPFQAFGDLTLTGGDMIYTKAGVKQNIGGVVYTYDANGRCIKSEQTIRNVDGVWSEYDGYKVVIPEDAVIKDVSVKTDDLVADSVYYIDPITGEFHFLELRNEVYYNGELISYINCGLDEFGNMREWDKTESVLDSQGRPIEVIRWSTHYTQDPVTGKETWVLKPGRKYEYEYRPDNLVTKTESYMRYDDEGNGTWVYDDRFTKGVNSEGIECYEYMWYSESDTLWYGSDKYESVTTEKSFGSQTIQKYWNWDSSKQDWTPSGINKTQNNNKGNKFYSEHYEYDDNSQDFYLYEQQGWDYQGDTLECGSWEIYYYDDGSGNFVPSYGDKKEYMNYTWEELKLSKEDYYYYSQPKKYEISYDLAVAGDGSTSWTPRHKTEYEYVVMDVVDSEKPRFFVSDKKESYWDSYNQDWSVTDYKYEYNDHGDEITVDTYRNDVLTERKICQYEYRTIDTEWYSYIDKHTLREEYWKPVNGELVCWEIRESDYNDNGRQILSAYRSDWDSSLETWSYGYKETHGYDQNGNDTMYVYYSWNTEKKVWQGEGMEVKTGNGTGKEVYAYYNGTLNDNNDTEWIPTSYSERVTNESGSILSQINYGDWNQETGFWDYGDKIENEYTATGEQAIHSEYYWTSGEWVGSYRFINEYDQNGRQIQHSEYRYYSDWVLQSKMVYTYTPSGQEQDVYTYRFDDNAQDLILVEKSLAMFTGDRITEYVDSVYEASFNYDTNETVWRWVPSSKKQLTYDDESGSVNVLYSEWDSYSDSWQERAKSLERRDSKGRIIYTESYSMGYDYYADTAAWIGSGKGEYAYGPNDNIVMHAIYYWDSYESRWVGNYKSEGDFDPVSKKETLSASYSWDYNKNDWRGDYEKREYAYDSNGNQIMSATYFWDDDKWTWAPSRKNEFEYDEEGNQVVRITYEPSETTGEWTLSEKEVNYTLDDVYYYETYTWDAQKQAWRGQNKHDHSYKYNSDYEMSASYEWDEDEWCWTGYEKDERQYNENSFEMINYKWNKSTKQWVKDNKTLDEYESTDTYQKQAETKSIWNQTQSKWELDTRTTALLTYRSDKNVDYESMTWESYDGTDWSELYNARLTFNYDSPTKVQGYAAVDLDINVYDGVISVSANQDSIIRIVALSGAGVAWGVGSVSASVAPGTYMIVVDGKTVKVQVK